MINKDEEVVMFCNRETFEEFPKGRIPMEAVILTELLEDQHVIMIPKAEFLEWLDEGGQELKS